MKIEIAEPGRMTQSGSSLIKLIQNNKTPILDLLVRESIQNSLDAHKSNVKSVTVEYIIDDFCSSKLCEELEGITPALLSRFPSERYQYLAIRDSNTVGLTGEMDYKHIAGNDFGNLLKLVYEIGKPQDSEGAGGSWGLGKTIYFRIGIGLVVYYSRIEDSNGGYSSRLVASLVENETSDKALIPEYKGMTRRGIAWWGQSKGENTTIPVTDEEYINHFLKIFGIKPYSGDETGTVIIIPYISGDTLLANNRIDYSDELDEHLSPFWYSSIEEYLRIAVQRWYAPRLCNPDYPYGAYLKVLINGKGISADSMEPVFKTVQALYNKANHVKCDDFFSARNGEAIVDSVIINKLLTDTIAGNIACTKLTSDVLGMMAPDNKPEPAVFFNCEVTEKASNRPLVFFVRQPGMIVSYETISPWTAGIPSTNKNEFIFGAFVLNSQNTFKVEDSPVAKLEEYVRRSEMADHTSWNDWTNLHFNPRIISKIQKAITRKIGNQYAEDDVDHQPRENSELSRFLGDLILPPDGYGKGASTRPVGPNPEPGRSSRKKFVFSVITSEIKYSNGFMAVPMDLKTSSNKKIKHTAFEIQIDSEKEKISLEEWETVLKLSVPFFIDEVDITVEMYDGEKTNASLKANSEALVVSYKDIDFSLRFTSAGSVYGLDISSSEEHSVKIKFVSRIRLNEKNVRPAFVFEKEGQ